jgi:hypothetical protein
MKKLETATLILLFACYIWVKLAFRTHQIDLDLGRVNLKLICTFLAKI